MQVDTYQYMPGGGGGVLGLVKLAENFIQGQYIEPVEFGGNAFCMAIL
jgi:hypothetical protein